nr:hypothetical protein [Nostoc sp. 'Peltigera membranacea cyanobiont' 213]
MTYHCTSFLSAIAHSPNLSVPAASSAIFSVDDYHAVLHKCSTIAVEILGFVTSLQMMGYSDLLILHPSIQILHLWPSPNNRR